MFVSKYRAAPIRACISEAKTEALNASITKTFNKSPYGSGNAYLGAEPADPDPLVPCLPVKIRVLLPLFGSM